jgi:hypothetical protein
MRVEGPSPFYSDYRCIGLFSLTAEIRNKLYLYYDIYYTRLVLFILAACNLNYVIYYSGYLKDGLKW